MKSKIFTLFAAFVLLFSAQASAQTNGDVNDDGKVNEQDIAAILEIMAEAGGVKEQTKYYWYCGQTKPTSMANNPTQDEITDGTSDTDFKPNTWHPLTKDATSIAHTIVGGTSGNAWYIAVPTSFGFKPTATDLVTPNNSWTTDGTITVGNVEYTLWKPAGTSARQAVYMAKEQTKYYWYVGQENPANMTSISPIVTDNTSPGWRLIGTTVPTYDKSNPLWNSDKGEILFGDTKVTVYLAIPSANIKYRNDITGEDITSDGWEPLSPKTINNVNYNLYKSTGTLKRFGQTWY